MISQLLQQFPAITLPEMKNVKLLNRIDTKYVTNIEQLQRFLSMAVGKYYVQETCDMRLLPYHTIYLDTPSLNMYHDHHNGHKHRNKVRMRMYESTHNAFLEVKDKNNHGRTKKKRIEISELIYDNAEQYDFVNRLIPFEATTLTPAIENRFRRITLVNKKMTERLTIDLDLYFHNIHTDNDVSLSHNVIIELKRDGLIPSPATKMLRQLRIQRSGFSKYAIGMALTDTSLKQNNFKERIRYIKRLTTNNNI